MNLILRIFSLTFELNLKILKYRIRIRVTLYLSFLYRVILWPIGKEVWGYLKGSQTLGLKAARLLLYQLS